MGGYAPPLSDYFFFHIFTSLSLAPCVAVPFISECLANNFAPLSSNRRLIIFFMIIYFKFLLIWLFGLSPVFLVVAGLHLCSRNIVNIFNRNKIASWCFSNILLRIWQVLCSWMCQSINNFSPHFYSLNLFDSTVFSHS